MAHLLPVYEAFEDCLRGVLLRGDDGDDDGGDGIEVGDGGEEQVVVKGLRGVYMRGLERAGRLRGDVERTSSRLNYPLRRLDVESEQRSRLEAFTDHVRTSTPAKPHLLLAYTWVLYMALFSGGRYVRSRLRQAGIGFWERRIEGGEGRGSYGGRRMEDDEKGDAVDGYLGFWTFDGEEDGEDLKTEFKQRFATIEATLTEAEKEEVVQEAVFIMRSITGVVVEISEVIGTGLSAAAGLRVDGGVHEREEEEPSMRWLLLKHVLPMGMVELIAAGARSAVSVGMGPLFWSARAR